MGILIRAICVVGLVLAAPCAVIAESEGEGRKAAATLFGEPIYLEDVVVPEQWNAQKGKSEEEYAAWMKDWQLEQVQGKIWSALMDQFCEAHACEPTEEEYQEFERGMESLKRAEDIAQRADEPVMSEEDYNRVKAEMLTQFQDPSLSEKQKAQLEEGLKQLEEVKTQRRGEISRNVARVWIRTWKFNKALYGKYGGRVIWQQAGLEPLDAYETWLKESEQRGAFTIHDPELNEKFWAYFRIGHLEVDEDVLKESGLKHPFEKPWWLLQRSPSGKD